MKQYRYLALTEGRNPQEPTGLLRELETDSEYFLEYLDENGEWILDYELATYTFGESPNATQVNDATARQIASKLAPAKKFHLAGTDDDHDQSDHAPNGSGDGKGGGEKDTLQQTFRDKMENDPEFKAWREKNPDAPKDTDFIDSPEFQQWKERKNKEQATERTAAIHKVAEYIGPPEGLRIEYQHERGQDFNVGETEWTMGGAYYPGEDRIVMFSGAFSIVDESLDGGLLAHEIMHAKFHRAEKLGAQQMVEIYNGPPEFREKWLGENGRLNAQGVKDFPALAAREMIYYMDPQLIKEDGVSPYSKAYWEKYEADLKAARGNPRVDASSAYARAVNETLAEISRLKYAANTGAASEAEIAPSWNKLYYLIQDAAPSARRLRARAQA